MALVTEVGHLVPVRCILGCSSRLAISELDLGALVVVFLRRVVLPIMGEQDVEDRETSADQTDTTFGVAKNKLGDAGSRVGKGIQHVPRHNHTHEDDSLIGRATILEHQHESVQTEPNGESTGTK